MNVCSCTNGGQRAPLGVFPQELFTLFPEIGSLTGDLELAELLTCAPGVELRFLCSWEKQGFGYRKEKDNKHGVPQLLQGKSLEA